VPPGDDLADAEGVPASVRAFFGREVRPHVRGLADPAPGDEIRLVAGVGVQGVVWRDEIGAAGNTAEVDVPDGERVATGSRTGSRDVKRGYEGAFRLATIADERADRDMARIEEEGRCIGGRPNGSSEQDVDCGARRDQGGTDELSDGGAGRSVVRLRSGDSPYTPRGQPIPGFGRKAWLWSATYRLVRTCPAARTVLSAPAFLSMVATSPMASSMSLGAKKPRRGTASRMAFGLGGG
jgi:hypothetical protein